MDKITIPDVLWLKISWNEPKQHSQFNLLKGRHHSSVHITPRLYSYNLSVVNGGYFPGTFIRLYFYLINASEHHSFPAATLQMSS